MSDLAMFRDHCRAMAVADQRSEHVRAAQMVGLLTPENRALWARLADEVDAYLSTDEEGLFA